MAKTDTDSRLPRTRIRAGSLLDALKDVLGAASGKDTIPILGNVLISASENTIGLTATDLDLWVTRELVADASGEPDSAEWNAGSCGFTTTIPAKLLAEVVAEIDADAMLVLTAPHGDEPRFMVKAGQARFKLPCLPVADFPMVPVLERAAGFELAASALGDHLARVEHAISTEETRYYLNGVFAHVVQAEGEAPELRLAATDGHRLARLAVDAPFGSEGWPDLILARRSVALLDKLCAGAVKASAESVVSIAVTASGDRVRFELTAADEGSVSLVAKTIDGTFPDYTRVIPTDPPLRAVVDRLALAAAVKRVGVLVAKSSRAVRLEFSQDRIVLTGRSADLGEAVEELACDYSGEDLTIGFDGTYLRAALLAVGADQVALLMSDPAGPCRIEAAPTDGETPALVQVVMPVSV